MIRRHFIAVVVMAAASAGACRKPADPPAHETPTLDVTSWTGTSELFMEYPPLVTGHSARFAVHLTRLDDFQALNAGTPSIEFTPEQGGTPAVRRGSSPSRPGAFRVEGAPPIAGRYRWALLLDAPGLTDRHDLGSVTVFADEDAATAEAEAMGGQPLSISLFGLAPRGVCLAGTCCHARW